MLIIKNFIDGDTSSGMSNIKPISYHGSERPPIEWSGFEGCDWCVRVTFNSATFHWTSRPSCQS